MLLINCPYCGARNVSEFRFGGEYKTRPADPITDAAWIDYLYMKENRLGQQTEWWYHRAGCGTWFLAERDTATQQIATTYVWHPEETV